VKRIRIRLGMSAGLTATAWVHAAQPLPPLPSEDRILPSSLELERRVEPWCPDDCAVAVPFVASYRNKNERLVFLGVRLLINQPILQCGQLMRDSQKSARMS
jgi:hypothetical protein